MRSALAVSRSCFISLEGHEENVVHVHPLVRILMIEGIKNVQHVFRFS